MKICTLFTSLLLSISAVYADSFLDDFGRGETFYSSMGGTIGDGWVNAADSNQWKISGDRLFLEARRSPAILFCNQVKTISGAGQQFSVSAEVSIGISNGWAGIVFNYQDSSNFYCLRFKAGSRSYQLLAKIKGKWVILQSANDALTLFKVNTGYLLSVSSEDACEFYFTITGVDESLILNPVCNAVDSYSHFMEGYAGCYSQIADQATNPDVVFDNFKVEVRPVGPRKKVTFIADDDDVEYQILQKQTISSVWSVTPVGFAFETVSNFQFVVFYDENRQMTAGQRMLGSTEWTFQKLPSFLEWDSHNYIEMALDSNGFIHISGNMHVVPLVYFRSSKPYDVRSLEEINRMTGEREQRCTYPKFLKGPGGELIFNYRDGHSGNGDQIYNVYNDKTRTWTRLIDQPLAAGLGARNAYFVDPVLGPDGWFHITWVWRETYECDTNHDLSYARSKDLVHWETASGIPIDLPILVNTPGVVVDPVPVHGGILNGNGKIGFDSKNRVVLAYHKFDESGKTQLYNARLEDGGWKIYQTSDWDYRWYFAGGGCIVSKVKIGPVALVDGELQQSFYHAKEGSGIFVLDEGTLKPVGVRKSRQWPMETRSVRSDFSGMQVKTITNRRDDIDYLLRWETLPAYRDIERPKPWPAPSALDVYKIRISKK